MSNAFDKNAPKGAGKGKVVMMLVLAGVLAGVVVFHFSNAPKNAAAAEATAAATPTEQEFLASAKIALLTNDPTRDILFTTRSTGQTAEEQLSNPFAISAEWFAVIHRNKSVPGPTNTGPVEVHPQLPSVDFEKLKQDIKIGGIFKEGAKRAAIVNGNLVHAGVMVPGSPNLQNVQIIDILEDHLLCQVQGYGEAGQFEVHLANKLPGN